jgi:oligopeptide/dipeptide ABC transporter ATP-binding protein
LLDIRDLSVVYRVDGSVVRAVNGLTLAVFPNELVGLTGESGCGKSTLSASILRILPKEGKCVSGQILFEGTDLISLPEAEMRRKRWAEISVIFQNAMNALDPVYRVRDLLKEALTTHEEISGQDAMSRVMECVEIVRIPRGRVESYPHELSGGMRQRVMIAMALVCKPRLVIADEPTTGLDVILQDHILERMKSLQRELGFSMIFISHDLSVIIETCSRVGIMYAGGIVEMADTDSILENPRHPYTIGLLSTIPTLRAAKKKLRSIPGAPPSMTDPPVGCSFMPRCPLAGEICKTDPPNVAVSQRHYSRCHYALDPKLGTIQFE